jgi:hypothetical protein
LALIGLMAGMVLKSWLHEMTMKLSIDNRSAVRIGKDFFYIVPEDRYNSMMLAKFAAPTARELARLEKLRIDLSDVITGCYSLPSTSSNEFVKRLMLDTDDIVLKFICHSRAAQ